MNYKLYGQDYVRYFYLQQIIQENTSVIRAKID